MTLDSVCYRTSMANGKCSADGCRNEGRLARGWCLSCYSWSSKHEWADPGTRVRRSKSPTDGECTVIINGIKCSKPYQGNGMCTNHNRNRRVHGDPLKLTRAANGTPTRMIEIGASADTDECITYQTRTQLRPTIRIDGRWTNLARAVWASVNGDPGESFVLHTCNGGSGDNGCINIRHLYLGDHSQNMCDRGNALRQVNDDHHGSKFTNGEALAVIDRARGGESYGLLAAEYGVAWSTIRDMVERVTWARLPGRDAT